VRISPGRDANHDKKSQKNHRQSVVHQDFSAATLTFAMGTIGNSGSEVERQATGSQ